MLKRDYFDASNLNTPIPGKTLYVLGLSNDGPIYEPILVRTSGDIRRTFGQGELVDAALQILSIGSDSIDLHLVRIGGSYAYGFLYADDNGTGKLVCTIRSKYAGAQYNDVSISQDVDYLYISMPGPYGTIATAYRWSDFPTLGALAGQINNDSKTGRGLVYFAPHDEFMDPSQLVYSNVDFNLEGGTGGISHDRSVLYSSFALGYSAIEGRMVDFVLPVGIYFNDNDAEPFHVQLIDFCRRQSVLSGLTHGIIGLKPAPPEMTTNQYYEAVINHPHLVNTVGYADRNESEDPGMFLSIVAGEGYDSTYGSPAYYGLAAIYAAMVASAEYPKNLMMQRVNTNMRFEFSAQQLKSLADAGVVAVRYSTYLSAPTIASPITAAKPMYESHYLTSIGGLQASIHTIRDSLRNILGEQVLDSIKIQNLETNLSIAMDSLVSREIISRYRIQSIYYPSSDHLTVSWDIVPYNSVNSIPMSANIAFRRA